MKKLEGEMLDQAVDLYVMKAKNRIRDLYHQTYGACYLSFSGGKDSTVVLALIKLCEEDGSIPKNAIPAVFCNTHIEMDAIENFVNWVKNNWYENVVIIQPEKSFSQVLKEYGKPAISKVKSNELYGLSIQRRNGTVSKYNTFNRLLGVVYGDNKESYHKIKIANKHLHFLHDDLDMQISDECCHQLKKLPFEQYAVETEIEGFFTGERMAEGGARQLMFWNKAKLGSNICTRIRGDYTIKSPLVDWPDEVLERFIELYNVPLSIAYTDYGMCRTGCYLCPFAPTLKKDLEILHIKEPKKYKGALGFLKDVYIAQGIELDFDPEYMKEFNERWPKYEKMRYEMLRKYRPDCRLAKKYEKDHEEELKTPII